MNTILRLFLFMVLGSCMASFLQCLQDRLDTGFPLTPLFSVCPSCGKRLLWKDLIPVFSWLRCRGSCRYCGAPIPKEHLLWEAGMGVVFGLLYAAVGNRILMLRGMIAVCLLQMLAMQDLRSMRLSEGGLILLGLTALIGMQDGIGHALSWLLLRTMLGVQTWLAEKVMKKEVLGEGDVKLYAVCSLYVGVYGTMWVMFLSACGGLVYCLRTGKKTEPFPFGPFIAAAFTGVMILMRGGMV